MKKLLLTLLAMIAFQAQSQCWEEIKFGSGYAIAVKSDGTLWAWGTNTSGQLGDGTTIAKTTPIQVGTDTDWKTIATGQATTLALKNNGTIWEWGNNFYGQITGGSNPQTTPLQIGTDTDWNSISTGGDHMLALKNNGTLWVWGANSFGSLGLDTTTDVLAPVQLGTATDWKTISTGSLSSYAIKTNGTLWAWGWNASGQIGIGTGIGNNAGGPNVLVPTQVGTQNNWADIDAGGQFVLAQKNDKTLWSWGSNVFGELGSGTSIKRSFPVQIGTDTWISFTAGNGSCNGIKADGSLYRWGIHMWLPVLSPTQLGTDTDWSRAVSTWQGDNLSVKTNNNIYVWGTNNVGQLGLGDTNSHPEPTFFGVMCNKPTAGLQENTLSTISVYPNPTTNTLNISNTNNLNIEKLTVIDVTGKTLLEQKNNTSQIDVQQLPAGLYILEITANGTKQHTKFIKE